RAALALFLLVSRSPCLLVCLDAAPTHVRTCPVAKTEGTLMDEARPRSLSLVLPAYNEAAGIAEAVAEADDALARFAGDYEILVVDDGSRDETAAIVAEVAL